MREQRSAARRSASTTWPSTAASSPPLGFSGREIGEAKRRLLELVVEDPAANVPAALRQAALELRSAGT